MVSNPVVLYRLSFYHIIIYHIQYVSKYRSSWSLVVGGCVCVLLYLVAYDAQIRWCWFWIYLMPPNLYTHQAQGRETGHENMFAYCHMLLYLNLFMWNGQQEKKNLFLFAPSVLLFWLHNILYYL